MRCQKYKIDDAELTVDTEEHKLLSVKNLSNYKRDIHIPEFMEDGTKICGIGEDCFSGKWGIVTFSDSIKDVESYAFSDVCADTLVWPASVLEIPGDCFESCHIGIVKGLENVLRVSSGAFTRVVINTLVWPSLAKNIPCRCFKYADIKDLSGLDGVINIEPHAFWGSKIKHIKWPQSVKSIPMGCFFCSEIESVTGVENVVSIGAHAFEYSKLKSLDLFTNNVIMIEAHAFRGVDPSNIVIPYYMDPETFNTFFDPKVKQVL